MKLVIAAGLFQLAGALSVPHRRASANIVSDINVISQYWGQISPYVDNAESYFGVDDVGLPDGCQIEQVHSLQRHADRFPTAYFDDGINDENFSQKVENFTEANPSAQFTGPLAFLNSYQYQMGESILTGLGAMTEFQSGVCLLSHFFYHLRY